MGRDLEADSGSTVQVFEVGIAIQHCEGTLHNLIDRRMQDPRTMDALLLSNKLLENSFIGDSVECKVRKVVVEFEILRVAGSRRFLV